MDDIDSIRQEFPLTSHTIHLNHAGISPLSRRAALAMQEHIQGVTEQGTAQLLDWVKSIENARKKLGQLLHVQASDLAFTRSTTHAILQLANALPWRVGDNVVITDLEFPANVYPWLSLKWRGVETRIVQHRPDGRIAIDDLVKAMDNKTRVLALSWVEFPNGFRHDLGKLSQLCSDKDILFCVDLIQGLGALSIDLQTLNIDMAAGATHKWLLGPQGYGYLYCKKNLIEQLLPGYVGWYGVEDPLNFLDYDLGRLRDNARRFEESVPSFILTQGVEAALSLLLEVNEDFIEMRMKKLTDHFVEQLKSINAETVSPRTKGEWSGIIAIKPTSASAENIVKALQQENIVAIVRDGNVRFSPHFYNTVEELDQTIEVLKRTQEQN